MTSSAGRTALITGASSGIGAAMALNLARRGWRLGLTGRDPRRLSATAERCAVAGGRVRANAVFDIRDGERFSAFVASLGAIDLYIGNAGVLDGRRADELIESRAVAADVLAVNLTASIDCLHRVLDGLVARASGRIVLVSSLARLSPLPDAPPAARLSLLAPAWLSRRLTSGLRFSVAKA